MSGLTRMWRPGRPVELAATLGPLRRGGGDPAFRMDRGPAGGVWRTARTPDGPATQRITVATALGEVHAQAWGPGAAWVQDALPETLGGADDDDGFVPDRPLLRESARRHAGWRVPRTRLVMEALAPAILEQKVTGHEARRSWRELLTRFGEPAPGPAPPGMRVVPSPSGWRAIPSWEWHRAGVDSARSRAVIAAARVAGRLESTVGRPAAEAERLLRLVPGVGVWTAAEVRQRAHGDPDAVSVGDLHIPGIVGMALVGHPVDDAGMLELLAPWAGHRYRVVRLIELARVAVPRRGPRFSGRDYRAI